MEAFMLRFMGCGECGAIRGRYNSSCGLCKRRKRRSEQQRNRRTGSPSPLISVRQSSVEAMREVHATLLRLHEYFDWRARNPAGNLSAENLDRIQSNLDYSLRLLMNFESATEGKFDAEQVKPIRRYRQRDSYWRNL